MNCNVLNLVEIFLLWLKHIHRCGIENNNYIAYMGHNTYNVHHILLHIYISTLYTMMYIALQIHGMAMLNN